MSLRSDWACWEVMKCDHGQASQCPAYQSDRQCWEVMSEIDHFSFNICRDCIVYIIKQKNPIFSQEEIVNIMNQKGVDMIESKSADFKVASIGG